MGRFLTRDTWEGDANNPMSYNAWLYVNANPVVYTDPSGEKIYQYNRDAAAQYAITWQKDYNFEVYGTPWGGGLGDCTNFVSQALKAGGMPEDDLWYFSKPGTPTTCSKYPFSHQCGWAWATTQYLYDYLTYRRGFENIKISGDAFGGGILPKAPARIPSSMLMGVQKGDVVFYRQDPGGTNFNHAALVVGEGAMTEVGKNKIYHELPFTTIRIADHSGGPHGSYSLFGPRSINDTASPVYEIVIVHIPDKIFTPDVWEVWNKC